MHWPPGPRRGRSGGFTAPVTAASIRSPRRRARSSRLCPAAIATSATALHVRETGRRVDFDAPGRLDMHAIEELGVPRDADFYLCGPSAFMNDLAVELGTWGVAANRIHTEIFGSNPPRTPGIAAAPRRPPHQPAGSAGVGPLVSFARSGLNVRWARPSKASSNLPRHAMRPCGGHAEPGSATLARLGSSTALSATSQSPWSRQPTAMR